MIGHFWLEIDTKVVTSENIIDVDGDKVCWHKIMAKRNCQSRQPKNLETLEPFVISIVTLYTNGVSIASWINRCHI